LITIGCADIIPLQILLRLDTVKPESWMVWALFGKASVPSPSLTQTQLSTETLYSMDQGSLTSVSSPRITPACTAVLPVCSTTGRPSSRSGQQARLKEASNFYAALRNGMISTDVTGFFHGAPKLFLGTPPRDPPDGCSRNTSWFPSSSFPLAPLPAFVTVPQALSKFLLESIRLYTRYINNSAYFGTFSVKHQRWDMVDFWSFRAGNRD